MSCANAPALALQRHGHYKNKRKLYPVKPSELYIDWNDIENRYILSHLLLLTLFFLFSEHTRTIELSTQVLTKNKYCSTTEIFHEQNEVRSISRAKLFGLSEFSVLPWRVLTCYTVIYLVTF